ncbi:MAG: hypothetical protein ABUS48_06540 [Pseudomonadota bacterium]
MRIWRAMTIAALLGLASCSQATSPDQQQSAEPAPPPSAQANGEPLIFCEEVGRRVSQQDCDDFNALARDAQTGVAAFNAPKDMKRGDTHTLQLAISYAPPQIQLAPPTSEATTTDATGGEQARPDLSAASGAGRGDTEQAQNTPTTTPSDSPASTDDDEYGGTHAAAPGGPSRPSRAAPPPAPVTPSETVQGLPGETVQFTPLVGRFMKAELTGVGFDITPQSPATQEVQKDSVTSWTWRVVAHEGGVRALTLTTVVEGCTADHTECVPLRTTTQNYTVNVAVGPLDKVRDFLATTPDWIKLLTGVIVALTGLIAAIFGLRAAIRKGRSGQA